MRCQKLQEAFQGHRAAGANPATVGFYLNGSPVCCRPTHSPVIQNQLSMMLDCEIKPPHARGEQANSTQTGPRWDSNQGFLTVTWESQPPSHHQQKTINLYCSLIQKMFLFPQHAKRQDKWLTKWLTKWLKSLCKTKPWRKAVTILPFSEVI